MWWNKFNLCYLSISVTYGHLDVNVTSPAATVLIYNHQTSTVGSGQDPVLKSDPPLNETPAIGVRPEAMANPSRITEKPHK